jgi:hypothetical protein
MTLQSPAKPIKAKQALWCPAVLCVTMLRPITAQQAK